MALLKDANFLIAGRTAIDAEMIGQAKNLRFIQKWGIGTDGLDVDAACKRTTGF